VNHVPRSGTKWRSHGSPKGKFEGAYLDYSGPMNASEAGHPFEMVFLRIPPGKRPWPYHSHVGQWEFYYVMEGAGEMRLEEGVVSINEGDAMMCPPGEAHQIHNTGESDLVVQIIANNPPVDLCHYVDSDKWGGARMGLFRVQAVEDYYDGEE
jgi:mannose-6-phosphate isomerase-like protein (cupin superfamily)